jgi:dihydroorotate dehydrogenase
MLRCDGQLSTTVSSHRDLFSGVSTINTAESRFSVRTGLSGRPLFALATRVLAETYVRAEGAFPLIGAGGIDSGATALAKMRAGASLIQLYGALIFHGLRLLPAIKSDLSNALSRNGHAGVGDMVGVDAASITAEKWPV